MSSVKHEESHPGDAQSLNGCQTKFKGPGVRAGDGGGEGCSGCERQR